MGGKTGDEISPRGLHNGVNTGVKTCFFARKTRAPPPPYSLDSSAPLRVFRSGVPLWSANPQHTQSSSQLPLIIINSTNFVISAFCCLKGYTSDSLFTQLCIESFICVIFPCFGLIWVFLLFHSELHPGKLNKSLKKESNFEGAALNVFLRLVQKDSLPSPTT